MTKLITPYHSTATYFNPIATVDNRMIVWQPRRRSFVLALLPQNDNNVTNTADDACDEVSVIADAKLKNLWIQFVNQRQYLDPEFQVLFSFTNKTVELLTGSGNSRSVQQLLCVRCLAHYI